MAALLKDNNSEVTSGGHYQNWASLLQILCHVTNCICHLPGHLDYSVVFGIPGVALLLQKKGGEGQ